MKEITLTPGKLLLALIIVAGLTVYLVAPETFSGMLTGTESSTSQTGLMSSTDVGGTGQSGTGLSQGEQTQTQTQTQTETGGVLPSYQIDVVRYVKDKLNPKSGISGVEVEVLEAPTGTYSLADLIAIASDINRAVVDEDTSTDSSGKAVFNTTSIFTNRPYIYSLRGDSTVYDKIVVNTIVPPSTQFKIDSYSFPISDSIYAYKVGSFSSIATDTDINCSDDSSLNITGKSGIQQVSLDITIGESEAGKALKDPVLVFRSPEGYEPPANSIVHIYLTRKTGTSFSIPAEDLVSYYEGEVPIHLGGSIYDPDYKTYLMTVSDSGTYTLKIQYDADVMQSGKKLQVVLDDLGDYRAMDMVTRDRKASTESLTFTWCS